MASIVFYASLSADSIGIRHWLEANPARVCEHGLTAVKADSRDWVTSFAPLEPLAPGKRRMIFESSLDEEGGNSAAERDERADLFVDAVEHATETYGGIVVADDIFLPLVDPESFVLPAMRLLSHRHQLSVNFYAPPQHRGLEGLWRIMGFASETPPSVFLARRAGWFQYASICRRVNAKLPDVRFMPIPVYHGRPDSVDVVADFASRFFGVEADHREWALRPPPLEVVNLLRAARKDQLHDKALTFDRMEQIVRLSADCVWPEDDRLANSRRIVHKYAFNTFARENAELGWSDLVPPPDDRGSIPELDSLDQLWESQTSAIERTVLLRALDAAT